MPKPSREEADRLKRDVRTPLAPCMSSSMSVPHGLAHWMSMRVVAQHVS